MDNDKIILNIGGTRFETNRLTLKKIPATRLSRLTEALANYDHILNEYFFDRHPGVFPQILNYYRTGKLHYPNNVCGPLFEAELEFWGLDSNQVEPCCWKTYTKHRDTQETLSMLDSLALDEDSTSLEELARKFDLDEEPEWQKSASLLCFKRVQPLVWQLFEEPRSSQAAKIISYLSMFFILLSILTYCLSTVKGFCPVRNFCRSFTLNLNITNSSTHRKQIINVTSSLDKHHLTIFDYIEYFCIAWFSIEFSIRFVVSPSKMKFFKSILNCIDFSANLWFYGDLVYYQLLDENNKTAHPAWDLFGTVRIMRLFKFFNHHQGLKIIFVSLKASTSILRLLIFFVCVAVIIFASLVFFSEKLATNYANQLIVNRPLRGSGRYSGGYHNENEFISVFEAIWFSIASLTTVGFGDYVPRSAAGMFFGACCTIAGVLMIDLPMPIICANFANYYNHLKARHRLPKKLRRKTFQVSDETPARQSKVGLTSVLRNRIDSKGYTLGLKSV